MSASRQPPPPGTYRIRTHKDVNPALFLTAGSTYVEVAPLDESNQKQLWAISKTSAGVFNFTNIATGQLFSPVEPNPSERDYRVLADKSANVTTSVWTIEPHGDAGNTFLIGTTDPKYNSQVVDLSLEDRIILWERNFHDNQYWIFEAYADQRALAEGEYRIRSKARANPDKYLYLKDDMNVGITTLDAAAKSQTWSVSKTTDGSWKITNASGNVFAPRSFQAGKYILRGDGGDAFWNIGAPESDGSFIVHSKTVANLVLDLAVDDWVVLWEPNQQTRQNWFFEKV